MSVPSQGKVCESVMDSRIAENVRGLDGMVYDIRAAVKQSAIKVRPLPETASSSLSAPYCAFRRYDGSTTESQAPSSLYMYILYKSRSVCSHKAICMFKQVYSSSVL